MPSNNPATGVANSSASKMTFKTERHRMFHPYRNGRAQTSQMRKIACIGARRHVTRSEYPSAIAVSNAPEKKPDRPSTTPRIDLSRMRHELRTPINHILGYSEMMLEEGNLSPQFGADLQKIHASGRELQSLIRSEERRVGKECRSR